MNAEGKPLVGRELPALGHWGGMGNREHNEERGAAKDALKVWRGKLQACIQGRADGYTEGCQQKISTTLPANHTLHTHLQVV